MNAFSVAITVPPPIPCNDSAGEPAELLVLVAQGGDQLADGLRRELPSQGARSRLPAEAPGAVILQHPTTGSV